MELSWKAWSFLALSSFAAAYIGLKALSRLSIPAPSILFWVTALCSAAYGAQAFRSGCWGTASWKGALLLLAVGSLCFVGNLAQLKAIGLAPNPGLALSIIACSAALATIAAIPLFGASITFAGVVGVALCLAGVILLAA